MITRRQLFKLGLAAGASLFLPKGILSSLKPVYAFSQSMKLRKFIQPLRGVGGSGIPVAQPDPNPGFWRPGVTHYTIDVGAFSEELHPDLPNPTRLWGYGQNGNFSHLGGIIAAKRGDPVQITFRNNLPPEHIIPVDDTIMGVMGNQNNRTNPHLHGGFVPWTSDGGPMAWWDPDGHEGPSFMRDFMVNALNPNLKQNEGEIYYPNDQGARLMWYHDHTFGLTRLNAYAGVATGYVVYDDYELELVTHSNIPGPLDPRTIYLVFQDKIFIPDNLDQVDPTWPVAGSQPGDLWYAHEYDPDRWDVDPDGAMPPPPLSVIPEYFGDTPLVNGQPYPFLEVEPREYRFRMLNANQARFLNPRLVFAKSQDPRSPDNKEPGKIPGPGFIQFGSEGGFLPYPALVNFPKLPQLVLAPAERADIIVDFRGFRPGTTFILYSDAPAPYPMGDPLNDYFVGSAGAGAATDPGFGPNSRTLMQIRIVPRKGPADAPVRLPPILHPTDNFLKTQLPGIPTLAPKLGKVRYVTLNEAFDEDSRLIQRLGTTEVAASTGNFGRMYTEDATEVVDAGSIEQWEIINLTGDTHPIHFHLVNVQLLYRRPFNADPYAGGLPEYTGKPIAPDMNELGWKETVRVNPGQVARVLMKFNLPNVPFDVPESPRTGGLEYVWHCHILEHEEHDMMRPLVVK